MKRAADKRRWARRLVVLGVLVAVDAVLCIVISQLGIAESVLGPVLPAPLEELLFW